MRISIDYATTYSYQTPALAIIQLLRLSPNSHEGQKVISWRLESDVDARLRVTSDAFGNTVHTLYTEEPTSSLTTRVVGEVVTEDTAGMVRGAPEPFPAAVYLRNTPLTAADAALASFAEGVAAKAGGGALDQLHHLTDHLHRQMAFDPDATHSGTSAIDAFRQGRGVCQDHAHVFIAAARRMGIPARYISGHLVRDDGAENQGAAHAWAEAHVEDLGWVAFDPANGISATDAYIRVAVGLDYLSAAPVRGAVYGGWGETMTVALRARQLQSQNQIEGQQ